MIDRLLAAGALDVFLLPAQMKKNRPGVLLTVLCEPAAVERLAELIFRETTSFGLRLSEKRRLKLERRMETVRTEYGDIEVKLGFDRGGPAVADRAGVRVLPRGGRTHRPAVARRVSGRRAGLPGQPRLNPPEFVRRLRRFPQIRRRGKEVLLLFLPCLLICENLRNLRTNSGGCGRSLHVAPHPSSTAV